jgi:hypothetical protein
MQRNQNSKKHSYSIKPTCNKRRHNRTAEQAGAVETPCACIRHAVVSSPALIADCSHMLIVIFLIF